MSYPTQKQMEDLLAKSPHDLAQMVVQAKEEARKAKEEKQKALAIAEQTVLDAIRIIDNDWSVPVKMTYVHALADNLHNNAKPSLAQVHWTNQRPCGHPSRAGALEVVHPYWQADTNPLHTAKTSSNRGPYRLDTPTWHCVRADPEASHLCDLVMQLYVKLGLMVSTTCKVRCLKQEAIPHDTLIVI